MWTVIYEERKYTRDRAEVAGFALPSAGKLNRSRWYIQGVLSMCQDLQCSTSEGDSQAEGSCRSIWVRVFPPLA